jgi:telomere-associated protein RIF1
MAINHPHKPISAAAMSIRRAPGPGNASLQHAQCRSVPKTDELSVDRSGRDLTYASDAVRTFALEELNISRMLAPPDRGAATSNSTNRAERNDESLRIVSAGLGRKRLKIMKYSGKGKGVAKVTGASFSPDWVEGQMCRKPELILEMLKRKR